MSAKGIALAAGVNVCRLVVALTFVFSGFVKAVDPLGTQYKIDDYLAAIAPALPVPQIVTLAASVALAVAEFSLGIMLLFAIHRRLTGKLLLTFMAVATPVTLWLAISNPIEDCGCFGDAVVITNWQTFGKNTVLLLCALTVWRRPMAMVRFISRTNQWIVVNYTLLYALFIASYSLYTLPPFDFRPYHIGANIKQGMQIPAGARQPQFVTTFIMKKGGVQKEFTLENYPDSTWTFVDSKTVQTEKGYIPPIHDLSMQTMQGGEDLTQQILGNPGYTFLLIAPHLEQADDTNFGNIEQVYLYSQAHGYPFYALTASGEKAVEKWREYTGAEYEFLQTDETTLKTIIRSNPGLVLIKNATVIGKWSHNRLPQMDEDMPRLEKTPWGNISQNSTVGQTARMVLWFILPLLALTFADRTWAWTKWFRKRNKKQGGEKQASNSTTY